MRGVEAAELVEDGRGFVGDFVGDCFICQSMASDCSWSRSQLTRTDNRDPGVAPGPIRLCLLRAVSAVGPIDGLGLVGTRFVALPTDFPFATAEGRSVIWTIDSGLMNMPKSGSQSKYLSPLTDPSFFPLSSKSSSPTHAPFANEAVPMYRMTP